MDERMLTTGQLAKLFRVAPRTAAKWIDSGALKGWRFPGSQDRRASLSQAIDFARRHGIPVEGLGSDLVVTALVLTHDDALAARVEEALQPAGWHVVRCRESFEAGMRMIELRPRVVLVDLDVGRIIATLAARSVAEWRGRAGAVVQTIGIAGDDDAPIHEFDVHVAYTAPPSTLLSLVGPAPVKSAWSRRNAAPSLNGKHAAVVIPS